MPVQRPGPLLPCKVGEVLPFVAAREVVQGFADKLVQLIALSTDDEGHVLPADQHHGDVGLGAQRPQIREERLGQRTEAVHLGVDLIELV